MYVCVYVVGIVIRIFKGHSKNQLCRVGLKILKVSIGFMNLKYVSIQIWIPLKYLSTN